MVGDGICTPEIQALFVGYILQNFYRPFSFEVPGQQDCIWGGGFVGGYYYFRSTNFLRD